MAVQPLKPEGLYPRLESGLSLETAIDNRPLVNAPPSIFPTESHVHHHVEKPERLSAFGLAPNQAYSNAGNYPLNEVAPLRA